jgi:hypothetical protein
VGLLLDVGPSFLDGFLIAIVDNGEGLVKLPLIVLLAKLAPIFMIFLLGFIYGVFANGEPRDVKHFVLLVGEAGGPMAPPYSCQCQHRHCSSRLDQDPTCPLLPVIPPRC